MLRRSSGISFLPHKAGKLATYRSRVNMDAHLIGIDLAQFLVKHKTHTEKQRPVKAAEPAADSAIVEKKIRTESH